MPNIKSQKDRVVQAKKEALHNKVVKSNLKTVVKKANAAIDSNAADKETVVKVAVSAIDSAKSKGVIHKNTAARKISRMAKRANKAAPCTSRNRPAYGKPAGRACPAPTALLRQLLLHQQLLQRQ